MHKYTFSIGSHYREDSTKVIVEFSLSEEREMPLEYIRTIVESWLQKTPVGKYMYRDRSGLMTWLDLAECKGIKSFIRYAESFGIKEITIRKAENALGDYTERVFFS